MRVSQVSVDIGYTLGRTHKIEVRISPTSATDGPSSIFELSGSPYLWCKRVRHNVTRLIRSAWHPPARARKEPRSQLG